MTDRLSIRGPSLCSIEGPSLRPDLPPLGRCGGQGWPPGPRSSRRAASLRAARGTAKLGKGEAISGLLLGHNGWSEPPIAAAEDALQLWETNPERLRLCRAQPRPSGLAVWVLARANSSSSCPKQPPSKENCFKDPPKRLSPRVKHSLLNN